MKTAWLWATSILTLPAIASAHGELPRPVIDHSVPAKIFPGHMATDVNGKIEVDFYGSHLDPGDGDNGHPAGWRGGYQHVQIRGVSATGVAGAWADCHSADCDSYGSTGTNGGEIMLGLAPRILSAPGGHLQVRVWVSISAIENMDPEASTTPSSEWSEPYTLDIAKPGETGGIAAAATATTGASSSSASSSSSSAKPTLKRATTVMQPHITQGSASSSSSAATSATGTVKKLQPSKPAG